MSYTAQKNTVDWAKTRPEMANELSVAVAKRKMKCTLAQGMGHGAWGTGHVAKARAGTQTPAGGVSVGSDRKEIVT